MDQQVNYRVNIDDSDFQARLSQMRASIDMTMGGFGGMGMMGFGGMGGMNGPMLGGMFNVMTGTGGPMMMNGLSDFGTQLRPVTYTPPAIAMQPHFGMIAVNQTMAQAGLGMLGPLGVGMTNPLSPRDVLPPQISMAEYVNMSARNFGMRAGDAVATGMAVTGSTAANLAFGAAGARLGMAALGGLPGGAFVGGLVGGAAAAALPAAYFGAVTDMMADNRSIQNALSAGSFRFITGGADVDPVTGRGFSRAARANVAQSIQGMQLTDARFGSEDYRQILEGGMQLDMFSGTRDATDFKTKFKSLVDSLKTVTATLHTSLKEGIEVIRGFRDMGVTDPGEINRLTLGAEAMGRASGRTGMEMLAIGQTGAEMFRGTGIRMGLGFESNQMNAMSVRSLLNQGLISREMVGQAGGENALAQQLTANSLASFQSAMGRGAMMANFNPTTGQFDPNMVTRMMGQGALGMISNAANLSPASLFQLQAHQAELIGNMDPMQMRMFSIGVDMAQARTVAGVSGANVMDVYKAMQLRRGVGEEVINANIAFMQQDPEQFRQSQQAAIDSVRTQAGMEDFRNRFGFKRITNALNRTLVQPVSNALMNISGAIEQGAINFGQRALGQEVAEFGPVATRSAASLGADLLSRERALGTFEGAVGDERGSFYQRLVGGQTSKAFEEDILKNAKDVGDGKLTYRNQEIMLLKDQAAAMAYSKSIGEQVNIVGTKDDQLMVMAVSKQRKLADDARRFEITARDVESAQDHIKRKGINKIAMTHLMDDADRAAERGETLSLDAAAKAVFGKSADDVTGEQAAELQIYLSKIGTYGDAANKQLKERSESAGAVDGLARGSKGFLARAAEVRSKVAYDDLRAGYSQLSGDEASRGRAAMKFLNERGTQSTEAALAARNLALAIDSGDNKQIMQASGAARGIMGEEASQGLEMMLRRSSAEQRKSFVSDTEKMSRFISEGQESANAASGGTAIAGNDIGQVSLTTLDQIRKMAEQLEANYKILQGFTNQLKQYGDASRSGSSR